MNRFYIAKEDFGNEQLSSQKLCEENLEGGPVY
jgi:hypothetical protein